jgi:hypothetical protein
MDDAHNRSSDSHAQRVIQGVIEVRKKSGRAGDGVAIIAALAQVQLPVLDSKW